MDAWRQRRISRSYGLVDGSWYVNIDAIVMVLGAHCIQVTAGELEVPGSPFMCEVFDIDHVYVNMPPHRAVVGKLYEFEGS